MEEVPVQSGNVSDATDATDATEVLGYEDEEVNGPSEMANLPLLDELGNSGGINQRVGSSGEVIGAIPSIDDVGDTDSEDSLDFGSDTGDIGVAFQRNVAPPPKQTYSSIAFHNTLEEAEKALHSLNHFVYTYRTRYLSPFVLGKVFQCRSHIGCAHRLKLAIHRADETSFRYQLLQRGHHSGTSVQLPERGISLVLKPEIDSLLKLGMSAGRVKNMMLFKYIREPGMLMHVPGVRKMENRKSYLKRKAAGGWEINTFTTLRNWTALKLCQDHTTYHSVDETNIADMNAMIVLDDFKHMTVDGDRQIASMGLIVTTRALFRNVRQAVQDQGSDLVMSTDGTYRIHFGGWTLVNCGGISVEATDSGFVQRFRPWLYMFVRTESAPAYEHLFRALVKYANIFFNIEVSINSVSIDHSDAIASALISVWPKVEILTCWEHLLRCSQKQSKLTNAKDFIKERVQPHLRMLHAARSLQQFCALSKRFLQAWRDENEVSVANWLQSVYLTTRWERWSVGSSSVPGFLPTQQPIESHHRVIKVIVTDYKKAPTISVLNSVLPRVLLYDATNLSSGNQGHYAEGPLPLGAVMKAKDFLLDSQNYRIVTTKVAQRPARIFLTA